jgi:membrane fusion protein (multidrug efflux system)
MQNHIRPKELIQQRNRRLKLTTLFIVLTALSFFGYWWQVNRDWVSTDDAFVMGHVITLEAQTEGTIIEILTENTLHVNKGDVLIKLDGAQAEFTLQHAEAELGETVRSIANVDTVNSQQPQIHSTIIDNHPAIEKAKSRVRSAFLNYQRRNVIAPISGYVAKRKAQIGGHVKAGAPLLNIVPLDNLWIDANFLETQIASIRPGQAAEIIVDAYGDKLIYHGKVQGITPGTGSTFALLPTDNATGNFIHVAERVQVRIGLDPKELKDNPLRPGLSTVTRINISETGKPLLTSTVSVDGDAYRTGIYENELDGVEQRIQQIITTNKR